jgi:hypothetical protein
MKTAPMNMVAKLTWWVIAALVALVAISLSLAQAQ